MAATQHQHTQFKRIQMLKTQRVLRFIDIWGKKEYRSLTFKSQFVNKYFFWGHFVNGIHQTSPEIKRHKRIFCFPNAKNIHKECYVREKHTYTHKESERN